MDKFTKENWLKILLGAIILILLVMIFTSKNRPTQISPRTYNLPTATEVFNLRSECATLGQRVLNNNAIGGALTQSQISHYNPTTNRCYVELTVQSADLSGKYIANYLSDGQTGDLLAFATQKDGKEYGSIYSGPAKTTIYDPSESTFQSTNDYINEVMKDDWKQ